MLDQVLSELSAAGAKRGVKSLLWEHYLPDYPPRPSRPKAGLGLVILNILFFSKCLRCYCHALSPLCTWRACRPTSQDCCWMPQEPIKDILVKHVYRFYSFWKISPSLFPRKHVIAPSTRFTSKERPLTLVAWLCRHDRDNIWYSLKRRTT